MKHASVAVLALILVMSQRIAISAGAQESPKTTEAETSSPPRQENDAKPRVPRVPIPLRVQLVVARYLGEKKVGSVPYSFLVITDQMANLRMGVEVPVPITSFSAFPGKPDGDKSSPVTSYQYRNVGTSIDCRAQERPNGLFALHLNIEVSSVHSTSPGASPPSPPEMPMASDKPFFRTFKVSLDPVLRDGQTVQTVASTDPVTGEVVKIEVTLNVVK